MTSSLAPRTGVDVAAGGDLTNPGDIDGATVAGDAASPLLAGEICGDVVQLSFGDPTLSLPSPGERVSGPAIPLLTRAGDIQVELTVGDGEVHPAQELTVTVTVDADDDD